MKHGVPLETDLIVVAVSVLILVSKCKQPRVNRASGETFQSGLMEPMVVRASSDPCSVGVALVKTPSRYGDTHGREPVVALCTDGQYPAVNKFTCRGKQ